ncbi:hypothetical protein TEA_002058 [Camellia sinensis var. sinensis]|uniref:Uncharacterized protein n=1 Tax=Camellia sinensis var. sinensis TaxID=542762 RepID=A0A4S4DFW0_CAMSN|nr:hypothetical protein TEA_002058 [Camellia sinensis var. sinensis]
MELSIHALPIPDSTKNMVPEVTRRSANYHPSIWGDHFLTTKSKNMKLSIHALPIPDSTKNMVPEVTRRSANYHPSIWGDHFLTTKSKNMELLVHISHRQEEVDVKMGQQLQQQKEEVRKMLVAANDQPSQKLNFIDAVQHLGVSYHFESEIEAALQHIYETDYDHHDDKANDDLYTVALSFRWWKELDFAKKMPFARDRIVECYFWILGVYFEPQYLLARRMLTKMIALTSIIDDIYDVYGTLEELALFTNAIERWEINAIDQLPEYMKQCYQALLDVYNMIDEEMARKGTSYRVHYAKSAVSLVLIGYKQTICD